MTGRRFAGGKLVIASHNEGKLREIAALLGPYGVETVSAGALGLPEPEETGNSFAENAALKARMVSFASSRQRHTIFPPCAKTAAVCSVCIRPRNRSS